MIRSMYSLTCSARLWPNFMVGTAGSMADRWATFLKGNAQIETLGSQVVDYMAKIPAEQSACFSAALATYFLARRQEELLTPLAVTLNEALAQPESTDGTLSNQAVQGCRS